MSNTPTVDYDYSGHQDRGAASEQFQALETLVLDLHNTEREVRQLQDALKKAQDRQRRLEEIELPEQMAEMGLREFTTVQGFAVRVEEKVHASIPKALLAEAHTWLEQHGNGGLIKREFTILFGRDEERWARRFQADLKRRKRPLDSSIKMAVHPQTLEKFVRDALKEGQEIPPDLFGIYTRRRAVVQQK